MSSPEENSDHDVGRTRKCCSFKYRIRWFNSKGAALVLVWNLLISASAWYLFRVNTILLSGLNSNDSNGTSFWIYQGAVGILLLVCAPLSGWLADARLGNYKVFKIGCVFVFFASVMACVGVMVLRNLTENNYASLVVSAVMVPIVYFAACTGTSACLVTSLQLGLDQMPDASAANITSFISWFVCVFFSGVWIRDVSVRIFSYCLGTASSSVSNCTSFEQIFSLFPVLCMVIVLCSDFLLSPKWLIKEPKSPQSLKIIYQVLKFAKKNKAPVNRSALTYWEEDIPSRIDLGKSKYGGPFTTEQVEDVKTIFKLLVVSVPLFMVFLSLLLFQDFFTSKNNNITSYFTFNGFWCVIIGTLVYEVVIYPIVRNKLPSILRRIGFASFLITAVGVVFLVVSVVRHFDSSLNSIVWPGILLSVVVALLIKVLLSTAFEFVCAQSPYNMRTLVTGYATLSFFSPIAMGSLLHTLLHNVCTGPYCSIIRCSICTALGIVGFVLHCILARWYKRRVRDDIYSPHRLVEEVYDRYLSAQPQIDFTGLTDSQ